MSEKQTFADKKRKTVEQAEFTEDGRYLRKVRSFVLRTGRLSDYQRDMMNNNWANLGLDYQPMPFNFEQIFGNNNPVVLEIGFGMGKSLVEMAEQNPNRNYIGIEVHTPGWGLYRLCVRKRREEFKSNLPRCHRNFARQHC